MKSRWGMNAGGKKGGKKGVIAKDRNENCHSREARTFHLANSLDWLQINFRSLITNSAFPMLRGDRSSFRFCPNQNFYFHLYNYIFLHLVSPGNRVICSHPWRAQKRKGGDTLESIANNVKKNTRKWCWISKVYVDTKNSKGICNASCNHRLSRK